MAKTKKESNNDIINKEELIKDIKKSLDEEISNKVEYEARNKLDKMERRIYRQKRWAIIRRDFIILEFLGLLAYETKLLYDNSGSYSV